MDGDTSLNANDLGCPIRDVLDRIGDAWTVLVVLELHIGPCRFNALRRVVTGISPRMLTLTLRRLERDGHVTREVLDTSPPQVEYRLTDLGETLFDAISVLKTWAETRHLDIHQSRQTYDEKQTAHA